jgi:hypothetical protein
MNYTVTEKEFDRLPYRDDVDGDYEPGIIYRARAHPDMVFQWMGGRGASAPYWDAYKVTIIE